MTDTAPQEPTTEAGRALNAKYLTGNDGYAPFTADILAIEAEARDGWMPEEDCISSGFVDTAEAAPLDVGVRDAAVRLRAAAVKAGAHIVVTTDYPDGIKAFGILCDAIDVMDAALAATSREATPLDTDALAKAIAMVEVTRAQVEGYVWEGPERTWFDGYAEDIAEQYRLLTGHV